MSVLTLSQTLPASGRTDGFDRFVQEVLAELLAHRIVVDNAYTRWFASGAATPDQLRRFAVQFSVFSNQFLVAQLKKMINAETLSAMRSAKEILANEIGVIFRPHAGRPQPGAALTDEAKDREGDPELVSTTGSVDGGTFRFRAGHFEWLLRFGQALGLGFGDMGKRRHGTASTLYFCDELERLYGNEDPSVAAGAGFAIENWAAAGFWQQLEDGLTLIQCSRMPGLPLAFFTWHNRVEAQHASHTHDELEGLWTQPWFDRARFLQAGREMLDGLAAFWNGLERDRRLGAS
jgi:hypothetical protein